MWGHRWGLHITATTAIPEEVPMNEVSDSPTLPVGIGKLTNRLRDQLWQDIFLVVLRHCRDNGRQWWRAGQAVLPREGSPQLVKIEILLGLIRVSV